MRGFQKGLPNSDSGVVIIDFCLEKCSYSCDGVRRINPTLHTVEAVLSEFVMGGIRRILSFVFLLSKRREHGLNNDIVLHHSH
jgi:hypothetical protein